MSFISVQTKSTTGVTVEHQPAYVHTASFSDVSVPAYVHVYLGSGGAKMHLTMEDARQLAELLPALIMTVDATERAAKEHAAAVAESKAA